MDYEWEAAKAAENRRRHGIDFADSIAAIEDPKRLGEIDSRFEYRENEYDYRCGDRQRPVRHHHYAR